VGWCSIIQVDKQIRNLVICKKIRIEPYDENSINPNSYDLHLGNHFQISKQNGGINPYDQRTVEKAFYEKTCSELWIQPGEFILGRTEEKISLPADIVGSVEGKSSLARLGLSIHQTGGWIDAGFSGSITLELYNCSPNQILLNAGMPIAQIVFFSTVPAELPYGKRKNSKYQNQIGATLSRYPQNRRPGMPKSDTERCRQDPKDINCFIQYYSREDAAKIIEIFKRVGRNNFSYHEIQDLIPNFSRIRKMRNDGIIERVQRRCRYTPTAWKFKPELAYRIEKALEMDDVIGN